ncbi:MAG: hypothetical protein H0V44_07105, partial [Planctomycetes bacterium]|nr:hypothetical protein [Planctomycetota bacterium]
MRRRTPHPHPHAHASAARRIVVVLALLVSVGSASRLAGADESPARVPGYDFSGKQVRTYAYELRQDVTFASAGDTLAYSTRMLWTFVLLPTAVTAERVELGVTILTVKATMEGPASHHAFDSTERDSDRRRDPLFAHLGALAGARLVIVVDPRTGAVSAVSGG